MKRFIGVLILVVVVALGVGFYLKWIHIGSEKTGGTDHITLTVDENKFKDDEKKVQGKLHDAGQRAKSDIATPTEHK